METYVCTSHMMIHEGRDDFKPGTICYCMERIDDGDLRQTRAEMRLFGSEETIVLEMGTDDFNEIFKKIDVVSWISAAIVKDKDKFVKDLARVLNIHCVDNALNMPDHIIAETIYDTLVSIKSAQIQTDIWKGHPETVDVKFWKKMV